MEKLVFWSKMSHTGGALPRRLESGTLAEAQAEAVRVWRGPEPGQSLHLTAYGRGHWPERGTWTLRFGGDWEIFR